MRKKFSELSVDEQLDIVKKTQNNFKDYNVEVEYTLHGDDPVQKKTFLVRQVKNDASACRNVFMLYSMWAMDCRLYPISMKVKGVHLVGDLRDYL